MDELAWSPGVQGGWARVEPRGSGWMGSRGAKGFRVDELAWSQGVQDELAVEPGGQPKCSGGSSEPSEPLTCFSLSLRAALCSTNLWKDGSRAKPSGPGRHCHSALLLTAIHRHHLGIFHSNLAVACCHCCRLLSLAVACGQNGSAARPGHRRRRARARRRAGTLPRKAAEAGQTPLGIIIFIAASPYRICYFHYRFSISGGRVTPPPAAAGTSRC